MGMKANNLMPALKNVLEELEHTPNLGISYLDHLLPSEYEIWELSRTPSPGFALMNSGQFVSHAYGISRVDASLNLLLANAN